MSDIEKDIKRCEQLTSSEHANWIGISNQLAIAGVLAERKQDKARIEELEAKLKLREYGDLDNIDFEEYMSQFISKQKAKDLIENETINISGFKCIAVEDLEKLLEDK